MAGKKKTGLTEENAEKLQQIAMMEQEAQAMEQARRNMEAEEMNKAHDPEFSPYVDGKGEQSLSVITDEDVKTAYQTLLKYKEGKADLEKRLEDNERFWKLRHWEVMTGDVDDKRVKPKSAWLFNTIINKHADAMDNYPEANILPRSQDDEQAAEVLTSVIPVILEQNEFEKTYSDVQWYKAKNGTGVYGVFWDNDKQNGLGDIAIQKIDLANLFWKPGVIDIQNSPYVFYVQYMDNEEIKSRWPEVKATGNGMLPLTPTQYNYMDEKADLTDMSPVIDWYYRRRVQVVDDYGIPKTKTVLHYCKFCNGTVIYASENDPNYSESGWYAHGKYPFVFDTLYPVEGSICGLGYIDIAKDDQIYIDKLQQAILENAISNARPRYATRRDSNLNEDEFLDLSKPLVHFDGNLGEDAFRQIIASPLSPIYETVYLNKVQELKDTTGNTASSQGQASSVTSASGIASLQEAAGKLSRDVCLESYRSYKGVVEIVIELIRQFYTEPRCFRIVGEFDKPRFIQFDNAGLMPQSQGQAMGIDLGSRLPVMDIDVRPQKKNAYSRESQNQTAMGLYAQGFFSPMNADASLVALNMMDFDGIEKVKEQVVMNQTLMKQVIALQQQVMQLAAIVDKDHGTNIMAELAQGAQTVAQGNPGGSGGSTEIRKGSQASQAASATRSSTSPR